MALPCHLVCRVVTYMYVCWLTERYLMCVCEQAYLINVVWRCYKYLISTHAVMPTAVPCQSSVEHGQLLSPSPSQTSSIQTVAATLDPSCSTPHSVQVPSWMDPIMLLHSVVGCCFVYLWFLDDIVKFCLFYLGKILLLLTKVCYY